MSAGAVLAIFLLKLLQNHFFCRGGKKRMLNVYLLVQNASLALLSVNDYVKNKKYFHDHKVKTLQ
jgi:hypothetical protein